jgi:hypothetical protein
MANRIVHGPGAHTSTQLSNSTPPDAGIPTDQRDGVADGQAGSGAPAPDAVIVSVSHKIAGDYQERGLPKCLAGLQPVGQPSPASNAYLVSFQDAEGLLSDAEARREQPEVRGRLLACYTMFIHGLQKAIAAARERAQILGSPAAVHVGTDSNWETWRGTKQQLQATGIGVGALFPGDAGYRWGNKLRDQRGWDVWIHSCYSHSRWGIYKAHIAIPDSVREEQKAAERKKQEAARELDRIKSMPATVKEFRDRAGELFWCYVNVVLGTIRQEMGYRLTDDAKEEFLDACRDAYSIIKRDGEVTGESPRKELQRRLIAGAKSNHALQSFLGQVQAAAQGGAA